MTLGILQRYVMGEVLRAFALALLTMTIIFVLFMVMAEASKMGLSPQDILILIPYITPSTFPYTVPVSLLFAVTVVYGRLASDNEVVAVKTAGVSALTILWPAYVMGAVLSFGLFVLSGDAIPRSTHMAKAAIFKNFEDAFYKWLKIEREFDNPEWPFLIKVKDVDTETKTMYQATFKHRNKNRNANGPAFDMTVQAKEARIKFDMDKGFARVYLDKAEISRQSKRDDVVMINDREFEMPVPNKNNSQGLDKKIQEWTTKELTAEQANFRRKIKRERLRQAMNAAFCIASGRPEWIQWKYVQQSFIDYGFWKRRISEYETEKQLRVAQSFGSFVFVWLGAPVGILFARRDFLSAFMSCFMPIILLYYPLMLLGVNLGKEEVLDPVLALWTGNVLLGLLAAFALRPIIRH